MQADLQVAEPTGGPEHGQLNLRANGTSFPAGSTVEILVENPMDRAFHGRAFLDARHVTDPTACPTEDPWGEEGCRRTVRLELGHLSLGPGQDQLVTWPQTSLRADQVPLGDYRLDVLAAGAHHPVLLGTGNITLTSSAPEQAPDPPNLAIAAPVDGGTYPEAVHVLWSARDPDGLTNVTLRVERADGTVIETLAQETTPANSSRGPPRQLTGGLRLATASVGGPGEAHLVLIATDATGQTSSTMTTFHLTGPTDLRARQVETPPPQDGVTVEIENLSPVTLGGPLMFNVSGEQGWVREDTWRRITPLEPGQRGRFTWDGTDDEGVRQAPGDHRVFVAIRGVRAATPVTLGPQAPGPTPGDESLPEAVNTTGDGLSTDANGTTTVNLGNGSLGTVEVQARLDGNGTEPLPGGGPQGAIEAAAGPQLSSLGASLRVTVAPGASFHLHLPDDHRAEPLGQAVRIQGPEEPPVLAVAPTGNLTLSEAGTQLTLEGPGQLVLHRTNGSPPLGYGLTRALLRSELGGTVDLSEPVAPQAYANLSIGLDQTEGGGWQLALDSQAPSGKSFVIRLPDEASWQDPEVALDGQRLPEATDLSDAYVPTDDGATGEWWLEQTPQGPVLVVSVDHFSARTLTLAPAEAGIPLWAYSAAAAFLAFLGLVVALTRDRRA